MIFRPARVVRKAANPMRGAAPPSKQYQRGNSHDLKGLSSKTSREPGQAHLVLPSIGSKCVSCRTMEPLAVWSDFLSLQDPRVEQTRRDRLMDIVIISVLAAVSEADGWSDIIQICRGSTRLVQDLSRITGRDSL